MSNASNKDSADDGRYSLVCKFMEITGCDKDEARETLTWCLWDLNIAVEGYFCSTVPRNQRIYAGESAMAQAAITPPPGLIKPLGERFSTVDESGVEEEEAKEYGPGLPDRTGKESVVSHAKPQTDIIIENVMKSLYETEVEGIDNAIELPDSKPSVTIKLWKEGFSVNEGPLIEYDDPTNKAYLDSVRQTLIPPESKHDVSNVVVYMNLEDHHHEGYSPFRMPRARELTGERRPLSGPTPIVIRSRIYEEDQSETGEHPEDSPYIDLTKPRTSVAIRLPDGSKLNGRFNYTHTMLDVRNFVHQHRPDYADQEYTLHPAIPIIELDDNLTIFDAHLMNSVIIMKLKRRYTVDKIEPAL